MPKELLRIDRPIEWLRTIIRKRTFGVETEFHFNDRETFLAVAIEGIVDYGFWREVMQTDCLKILQHSQEERGWVEGGRIEICINYDDDIAYATTKGSFVRFGPTPFDAEGEDAE